MSLALSTVFCLPLLARAARLTGTATHYSYLNSTGWSELEAIPEEAIVASCPLANTGVTGEEGYALQKEDEEGERLCCGPTNHFFQCFSIILRPKDIVYLNGVDPDILPGHFGVVTEISPPHVHAQFPRGTWPFWPESLRLGQTPADWPRAPSEWYCNCDECIDQLSQNVDFLSYSIYKLPQPGTGVRSMEVRAEFDPKVEGHLYTPGERQFVKGHRYVLFLYPDSDHNGAFGFKKTLCARLSCWVRRNYQLVFRVVDTVEAAQKIVDMFPRRSLHHVIIGGHGGPKWIRFGQATVGDFKVDAANSEKLLKTLREKLLVSASVILDACDTAGKVWVGSNFFTWVSTMLPRRRVIAAEVDLDDNMWEQSEGSDCLAGDSVLFKREGSDVTASTQIGRHLCADLVEEEIEVWAKQSKKCETDCGSTCKKAQAIWAKDERYNTNVALKKTNEKYTIGGCFFSREVCDLVPPTEEDVELFVPSDHRKINVPASMPDVSIGSKMKPPKGQEQEDDLISGLIKDVVHWNRIKL